MTAIVVWLLAPVFLLCCVVALPVAPLRTSILPSPPVYTQCNSSWANDPMGVDGPGERSTICGEGCAMSSVSMALAALGITAPWFDGELITPKSLNVWLMANKGYTCAAGDCNNLVLDSISRLNSSLTFVGESKHSWEDLVKFVTGPFAVLLHVRNNHHFVLATGLASSPLTFTVHDPMLYTNEYPYANVSDCIMYACCSQLGEGVLQCPQCPIAATFTF